MRRSIFNQLIQHLRRPIVLEERQSGDKIISVKKDGAVIWLSFGNTLAQSIFDPAEVLIPRVWHYFLLAPFLLDSSTFQQSLCILGFGGGSAAIDYARFFPAITLTGVEYDPTVIALAKKYFPLPSNLTIIEADAITFAKQSPSHFTYLLIDLFDDNGTIAAVGHEDFLTDSLKLVEEKAVIIINCSGPNVDYIKIARFYQNRSMAVFSLSFTLFGVMNTVLFVTTNKLSIQTVKQRLKDEKRKQLKKIMRTAVRQLEPLE